MAEDYSFLDKEESIEFGESLPVETDKELIESPEEKSKLSAFLSDPNMIQAMAELGANLDPDGVGGAIGKAAFNLSQKTADQAAGAKQTENRSGQMQQLLDLLQTDDGKNLVGDPEDMNSFNDIKIGDEKVTFTAPTKKASKRSKFSFKEDGEGILEPSDSSDTKVKADASFQGLGKEDLKGVSGDMLRTLLASDEKTQNTLVENIYKKGLADIKYGRDTAAAKVLAASKAEAKKGEREFKRETAETLQEGKLDQIKLKAKLGKSLTTSEKIMLKRLDIDIQSLGLQKEKLDLTKEQKEQAVQSEAKENIFDLKKTAEESSSAAHAYNKKYESNEVIYEAKGSWKPGDDAGPQTFYLEPGLKLNGKLITSKTITGMAEASGKSIEEVLNELQEMLSSMEEK